MATRTMPMFPLGTVLLPHALLPLHVFEERYRALVRDVLARDREFGVVLITRGHEVGGGDVRGGLGTIAHVLQADEFDDGRWAVVAVGTRRIRVVEWLDDDPYPRAVVEELEDHSSPASADLRDEVVARLRRVLARAAELGDEVAPATTQIADDPVVASFHATALAPIGPLDTQHLLHVDDVDERFRWLLETLDGLDEEFDLRLALEAGGEP